MDSILPGILDAAFQYAVGLAVDLVHLQWVLVRKEAVSSFWRNLSDIVVSLNAQSSHCHIIVLARLQQYACVMIHRK